CRSISWVRTDARSGRWRSKSEALADEPGEPRGNSSDHPAQRAAGDVEECVMRLKGKVAFITGGGTGIGAASAKRLAAEGAAVAIMGRTAETLQQVADAITEAGGRALAIPGDVAVADQVDRAIAATVETFGT